MKKISWILLSMVVATSAMLTLVALLHVKAQAAPGAICNWTGPQDAAPYPWSSVAYWDCGKVPGPGDTAIIDGGFRVVSIDAPVTVHNLVLFDGGSGSGIHGHHTLTVTGQMDWDGAIVGGAHLSPTGAAETVVIAPGALMRLTHTGDGRLLQARIVNYGTIEQTAGKWLWNYYGVIDNRPGGVYRVSSGGIRQNNVYAWPDDSGWFENAGALIKEGDDTFTFHMALTNSGQVSITGGALLVHLTSSAQVVTHTGAFAVAAPGILELGSYEHRFGPSSAISGDGILRMSNGARAIVGGAYTLAGLTDLIGGAALYLDTAGGAVSLPVIQIGSSTRLGGSSAITVTQALTMSNALLVNGSNGVSDTVNIAPGATLWVQESSGLSGRTLNNHGAVTLVSGRAFWMEHRAVFNNHPTGVFTVTQGDMRPLNEWSDCVLNNAGRIVKLDPGDFKKWYNISLNNTGSIEVWDGGFSADGPFRQTAGEVFLNGGTLRNTTENLVFDGGWLRGSGAISLVNDHRLENNGAILQPTGILMIDRGYSQGAGGALQIDIGGLASGSGYSVLQVAGDAALDGRLILSPTNGFRPAAGDLFQVLTYGSHSGEFAQVERGLGLAFGPEYQASGVVVSDNPTLVEFSQRPDRRVLPPGGAGGFSLRLTNSYSATVSVAFQDSLSAGLTFVPGSVTSNRLLPQPAVTLADGSQTLTWPALEIAAGEVVTIHFGVAVTETVGGYTNTAQVEVTPAGGNPRILRLYEQVDVTRSPTHDTVIQISPGVAYPPTEPNGLWTLSVRAATPSSAVSAVITSTPVCVLPECGALKRFQALHNGQTFTLTLVPGTTDHYRTEIPAGQLDLFQRIFLVPVFDLPANQTAHHLSAVQASGRCERVGGFGYAVYAVWTEDSGLMPCNPATGETAFYDPSGLVTDVRTGAPVVGATVTLYRVGAAWPDTRSETRNCRTVDTRPGGTGGTWDALPPAAPGLGVAEDPLFAPAAMDPAINPQKTDAEGHYGWDVVQGCWYVLVEAPGYFTRYSAVVGVPPEVTDLHIALEPWYRVYLPMVIR